MDSCETIISELGRDMKVFVLLAYVLGIFLGYGNGKKSGKKGSHKMKTYNNLTMNTDAKPKGKLRSFIIRLMGTLKRWALKRMARRG